LKKRKIVTINSYNEGWNNWSNYRYNIAICDEGRFQAFLKDHGYNNILNILKPDEMKYNLKLQEIYAPIINKCIAYDYDRITSETNNWKDLFYSL
jgi:hypothetical protein